jgi:AraC family transcriptional regulator
MVAGRMLTLSLSLLNIDHVQLGSQWNFKNVISPYHRMYYIEEGEGAIEDKNGILKLEAGHLYLIPNYTLCNLFCENYLSQYYVQFFEEPSDISPIFGNFNYACKVPASDIDVDNFKRLVEINPGRGLEGSDNPEIYEKQIHYQRYQALNELQRRSAFIESQGILLQLISRFLDQEPYIRKKAEAIPVNILDAIRFISIHLHNELSVSKLAERYGFNPQYFSRLFEEHLGLGPQAYVIKKRIERAKHMISSQNMSFTEIAERTGFGSISSFSKCFKRETGLSPRHYKSGLDGEGYRSF